MACVKVSTGWWYTGDSVTSPPTYFTQLSLYDNHMIRIANDEDATDRLEVTN